MKHLTVFFFLFITISGYGQTDSSKKLKTVDLFEIKYAGVAKSEIDMYLTRADLEAIEMRMTQFYYNKDKVDQNRIVYGILELYHEFANENNGKKHTFENFFEWLKKKSK